MYYKIINKESKVYQDLHALRTKELDIEKANRKAVEDKVIHKFTGVLGKLGQQNFGRTSEYYGFSFVDPGELDTKIWVQSKTHPGVYVPNAKTKDGRNMRNFLLNGLQSSRFDRVFELVGISRHLNRFTFPYLEICGSVIILYMDDNHEPVGEDFIEITKKEFESILRPAENKAP